MSIITLSGSNSDFYARCIGENATLLINFLIEEQEIELYCSDKNDSVPRKWGISYCDGYYEIYR